MMKVSLKLQIPSKRLMVGFVVVVMSLNGMAHGQNPYYAIYPDQLFPTKETLLPSGTTYTDTIPNTLDLATRAGWFIKGAIQSITPSLHDAPAGIVLRPETTIYDCSRGGQSHSPCLFNSSPNWGKVMNAITQARQMTSYDRSDTDHTLETQHRMMTNMLDWDVTYDLLLKGYPGIVFPQSAITPQTVAMQSVITEWKRDPSAQVQGAPVFQENWQSGSISPAKWISEGSGPFVFDLGLTGQGSSGDHALFLRDPSFTSARGIRSVMDFSRSQGLKASFKLMSDASGTLNFAGVGGPWSNVAAPTATYPILQHIEAGISRDESGNTYYAEGAPANWATAPLSTAFRNAFLNATTKANAIDVSVTLGDSTGAKIEWSVGGSAPTVEFNTIGQVAGTNWAGANTVSSTDPVRLFFGGVGNGSSHRAAIIDDIIVTDMNVDSSRTAKLTSAINEFLRMHSDLRTSKTDTQGKTFNTVFYNEPNPSPETFIGYLGNYYTPFIHGKALRVTSEWYLETGNPTALSMANDLSDFIRNYENSVLWQNPNPARFTDFAGPGQFVGHIHSWLQAAIGLATHAEALRITDPSSPLAQAELNLAKNVYNFVKNRTRAGKIGNFGESGSTGDMALLGIKLSEQNVGSYYDEVEAWTRNAMAETQIDPQVAQYIPNYINNLYEHTNVGTKTTGMFFADGTHISSIPFNYAGGTSDYAPNTFAGMYEVWNKTVEYKGNVAQINFGLNRASEYLDVKSDLPYRGEIAAEMKSDIGPIDTLGIRVPGWADQQAVSVVVRDALGGETTLNPNDWHWSDGEYVIVDNILADRSYVVKFPIEVYTETIYEMRNATQIWYEGSYPTSSSVENITAYTGTFRGNTLVDISPRPTGGFPRYQRQNLASLPAFNVAPPMIQVDRFVAGFGLPGDFDGNGIVEAADYTRWRDTLGSAVVAFTGADGSGNGLIDQADYDVWKNNFGTSGSAAWQTATVPEPVTPFLALAVSLGGFLMRTRRVPWQAIRPELSF